MITHYAEKIDQLTQEFYAENLLPVPNVTRLRRLYDEIKRYGGLLSEAKRKAIGDVAVAWERIEQRIEAAEAAEKMTKGGKHERNLG